ncbi:alpha/beta hydrolase fold domain-containing protein [Pseudomonas beijingensis]|uniref:Alpha/beta hydrolase fold domain-containing protein n=1 Tax=Pseudomonas beijingensis TaxID=2954101 RepID=A0ABY9FIX6_9PSED|nr:alpha/beta hydrolase fold domain-containing protein [Pseudomonas sp. FP2034]WLH03494.1 alpha/beta hydrolase fold domain-containing protein [Pseudomonas sp. FP2034]
MSGVESLSADAPAPVHPDLVAVATTLREQGLLPVVHGNVHSVRAQLERINVWAAHRSVPLSYERTLGFAVDGRTVPCKLYWPEGDETPCLMFYCHGGGFRHGSLAGWDAPLRQWVRDSGLAVLSIDYALSPEYRFPVAFNEVVSIISRVIKLGAITDCPVRGYALGGDSAGANLALGAAIALRDAGFDVLRQLLLFYGNYSRDMSSDSWHRLGGYGGQNLSVETMSAYWASYLVNDEDDWRVQPINADLVGLPPVRLVVGELDPLLDENRELADRLESAGVATHLQVLANMTHGFVRFNEVAPVVRDVIAAQGSALRKALSVQANFP